MIPSFLLLFQLLLFTELVKAHYSSDNTIPSSDDSVSNFQPSLPVVIGMLAIMFSLTFVLLLYAKFCHRGTSSSATASHHIHDGLVRSWGEFPLDKAIVESLPLFKFSSLKGSRDGLECAVCLSKFMGDDVLRLLPKCKHAFHVACIDLWLEKHATCPLCRHRVSADDLLEPLSTSFRLHAMEVRVERESSRQGSSRFSIGSCGKIDGGDELLENMTDSCDERFHRFNHRIHAVADVAIRHRWSNVTSSDLIFLNSEMLSHESASRIPPSGSGFGARLDPNGKRSMSEIVVHPRFRSDKDCSCEEERMRRMWVPIASKTLKWFANRDGRPPHESRGLNHQTSNV